MRIRPVYIVILIVFAVGGFVLYAALGGGDSVDSPPATRPARSPSSAGTLPPVDVDQALVPVLEIETDLFDMGTVTNREPTTMEVMITNAGRQKLEIREITTTCACTTGRVARNEILPGQSVPMEVTAYPNRIPGFYSHKRLTIMSNAPNAPMQNVDVIVRIEPEFEVEPDELDFGQIEKGERAQRSAVLRQLGDEAIEILDVRSTDETDRTASFSYEKRPESEWREPGKPEYTITATLEPWAPIGVYARSFQIVTTCERVPRYRRTLKAVIEGFYELSQNRVFFSLRPGTTRDTPIGTVVAHADRPVEIVNAEISGTAFTVETVPGSEPNSATVSIYLAPNASVGRTEEELRFDVRAEDGNLYPNLLPVRGVVIDLQ